MQSEIVAALNTSNNNLHQHRRKTAHGVGVGFPQANNTQMQGSSTSNINTMTGSHSQVPPLQINTNNIGIGLANGGLGTSADSRGNQSTSSTNGVQIISRKFIHFIGNNNNSATSQQQTARANTHSQKRHNNAAVGILPLNQLINNQNEQSSPRDIIDSNFMNPPASNRSGRSNGKGGIAEMLQSNRNNNSGGATIQLNGRASQRKSNGVVKMPGSNAVSAPHHQLGYRRHQIMDITDDSSNLASKNKLNGVYGTQGNNANEETLNSQESDRAGEQPSSMQNSNDGPAAYSMFYHTNQNQLTALATSGEVINRFNSKKNLKLKKQQQDQQLELNSPYSAVFPGAPYVQNVTGGLASGGPFQFTRKQNMMNTDNSLSATRETATQGGVKVIKLKKPQPIKISLHRDSMQSINAPSNSIGKRRPLIIRKNNYISGQGGSNERGSHKDMNNDTSPFNKTSNFNTLMSSGNNHGSSNVRLNNTSSFVGLSSEVSLSQTAGQIKNQTAAVAGISHILKTLNQTVPSEENLAVLQQLPGTNSHKLSQLTLKDAKLIRTNMSKKRLDTARKSRLHQIQVVTDPYHPGEINSLSQQPPESRQPNPLSQMMKKKRSLLPKSGKNANETQGSDVVVQTISSNGGGGSLHNMLIHRPSERGSRRETQRAQLTTAQNDNQRDSTHHNIPNDQTTTKMTSKSEERAIITDHSAPMLQQQQSANNAKMLSRGQIMRLQKQKQQIQFNTASNEVKNQDAKHERSPMNQGLSSTNRNLNSNKSSKSLTRGSASKDETHNSLTRVESKKDLQQVFKSGSSQQQQQQQPTNLEKHFVKEELVILENIHDSSGTPGDFQFITKQSNNLNQSNAQPKILHIQDDQVQNLQLNQPSVTEYQDSKGYGEDFGNAEGHEQEPPLIVQNQISQKQKFNSFGSGKKPNKQFPAQQQLQQQQNQVKPDVVPITEEDITQDTLTLGNNQQRLQNSSIAQVKSPIGTTTSFKSQNSAQQAGAYQDHIERFPMRPGKALKLYLNQLTDYEKGEILDYQDIYFLGLQAAKVHGSPKEEFNYGYDDDKGDYKVITKDHIGYRYEVLEFIGKGSFGTALKCFDHKTKEQVALKIVKNKKKYAYQAGIELKILNFLKENDPDDIMNVIHMKDYVIFRKHLCISFELLSMNLFEFLKINDFNGFDHNLIRRFAIQLLYALKYLREFQIIHCDLKPENILLKEANKSGIKIIDFGSSTFLDERVYTYIQSRFYRAPEIMLGIPYTCAIDMWSFGCIMAELYIGYPIFPGESENDQMSRIIEMVDKPNQAVYDISQRRAKFFTENADTGDYEPIMLKNSRGKLRKPGGKPLSLLLGDEDLDFLDFVQKCLDWDPEVRLTPDEALRHIWILKGLPPQVLVHHQRMHNIATPELPPTVREARDKFFLEANMQQQQQNTSQPGPSDSQAQQHSGQAQPSKNDGSSQLGGGASSSGNRFSTGGKTQNLQQQQQSQTQQQRPSLQNATQQQQQLTSKGAGSSKQHTNIKAETIKSLERAQLKNQLHQLNPNKHSNQASNQKTGALANIALHSKILTSQQPQGMVLTDTHRSDHSSNVLTSTANTARVNLQQQLAQIQAQNQQQLRHPPHLQLLPNMSSQQYSTLNSNISPNKGGVTSVFPLEGTQFVNSGKFAAGFKRRSHQATTAAVRHQRNNLLGNTVGGAGGGGHIQRPQDALTH